MDRHNILSEQRIIVSTYPKSVFHICGRAILIILTFGISEYILSFISSSKVVQPDLS